MLGSATLTMNRSRFDMNTAAATTAKLSRERDPRFDSPTDMVADTSASEFEMATLGCDSLGERRGTASPRGAGGRGPAGPSLPGRFVAGPGRREVVAAGAA